MGHGYHVHPYGARLCLSRRRGRLVQPPGSRLASIDRHGGRFLHRGAGGGSGETRQAGNLQHGSGQPIHQRQVHRVLLKNGIAISMDGKGSWRDNVFVERLWRSVKYEEVYLGAYDTVSEARVMIRRCAGLSAAWLRGLAEPNGTVRDAVARCGQEPLSACRSFRTMD